MIGLTGEQLTSGPQWSTRARPPGRCTSPMRSPRCVSSGCCAGGTVRFGRARPRPVRPASPWQDASTRDSAWPARLHLRPRHPCCGSAWLHVEGLEHVLADAEPKVFGTCSWAARLAGPTGGRLDELVPDTDGYVIDDDVARIDVDAGVALTVERRTGRAGDLEDVRRRSTGAGEWWGVTPRTAPRSVSPAPFRRRRQPPTWPTCTSRPGTAAAASDWRWSRR